MSVTTSVITTHSGVVGSFRRDLGDLWGQVEPLCDSTAEVDRLAVALRTDSRDPDVHPAPELEALLAGWAHFDAGQRAVLTAAVDFVVEPGTPQHRDDDDDLVVAAAVRAILRHGTSDHR